MNSQKVRIIDVDEEFVGQRLDNFLLRELKGLPRSRLYRLLRKGEVRVNKKRSNPSYRLQAHDQVRIPPVRLAAEHEVRVPGLDFQQRIKSACLYEDDALILFNKPSGVAVHGGSGIRLGFIEAVRQTYDYAQKWELVHRLDRDTSGCLMISKKRSFLRYAHQQLQSGGVEKIYHALVNGRWKRALDVRAPLYKNALSSGERVVRVSPEGKQSLTRFEPLQQYPQATLMQAKPVTGRTHQIRVHAQHQGHAIAGDVKYASDQQNIFWKQVGLQRLFLHAYSLRLKSPSGNIIKVVAPLPVELQRVLDELEQV